MNETKTLAIKGLVESILSIGLSILVAWWVVGIDATKEYGWYMGALHGAFFIPNWILSLFNDAILTKAPLHTTAYNVFWWILVIINFLYFIKYIFHLILSILLLSKSK